MECIYLGALRVYSEQIQAHSDTFRTLGSFRHIQANSVRQIQLRFTWQIHMADLHANSTQIQANSPQIQAHSDILRTMDSFRHIQENSTIIRTC